MKLARLPIIALPLLAILAIFFLSALMTAIIDQAHLRSAYQIWQENETFAAATIALLAATIAARPVYLQVRAQSVQASLELLRRIEADSAAVIETRNRLISLRRAAVNLAGAIDAYAAAEKPNVLDMKAAIDTFTAISPKDLMTMAERPTIARNDQMKIVALASVLSITQQIAEDILEEDRKGLITPEFVASERKFIGVKLWGLFSLSTEVADDLAQQEAEMRERAQQLRRSANDIAA